MEDFDHIAHLYDEDFTFSEIGKLQRERVWLYLDSMLPKDTTLDILELNCGTGEDAARFAERGHRVLATDISPKMVEVAKTKSEQKGFANLVASQTLDITALNPTLLNERKFDWVFSNFGGLNCLNEQDLRNFAAHLPQILKTNGRFIAVIMPDACLWERFYFLFKGNKEEAYRRFKKSGIPVPVEGKMVHTWYYSPTDFRNFFEEEFKFKEQKPIGLFVPPSYLEFYFGKRKGLLKGLSLFEGTFGGIGGLSKFADHFLCDLVVEPYQ